MVSDLRARFVPRHLPLPGRRTLRLRPVSRADVHDLVALYEHLSEDDLYRRFFQCHVPPRSVIESMTTVDERDGFRVVAEVCRPDGDFRLVGECGYELLPDGDGELAITVSSDSRGWLGSYMLDMVLAVAAERGVPNLQADVLLENRPMLAIVRARGYATIDHSQGPAIVRVVMGCEGRMPTWARRDGRPRILVEVPGGRWRAEAAARSAGMEVLVCPGPRRPWSRCPALAGRPCPLAARADVIVDAVPVDHPGGTALLDAHDRLHMGVPVCLQLPTDAARPRTTRPVIGCTADDESVVRLVRSMVRPRSAGARRTCTT